MTRPWVALIAVVAVAAVVPVAGSPVAAAEPATPGGGASVAEQEGSPNGTRLVHSGDALTLEAGPGQAVRGETGLPPGTALTVRVQSADEDEPYLRSAEVQVGADGAFRAVFDLSEVPPGTPLRALVHREGRNLTATPVEVTDCETCPSAMPDTPSALLIQDGEELTVDDRPGQVVRGRTNLPPGSAVTVDVRSSAGASPFVKQAVVPVDSNGTFRAVFDFEGIEQDVEFRVAVRFDGTELTTTRGRVACRGGCGPTVTPGTRAAYEGAEVGVVQVANGSVARVRLRLGDADTALLTMGSPSASYALEAAVRDGDGDGEVVVLFDTGSTGDGAPASAAAEADRVEVHEERGRFEATDYRLALHPPGNDSTEVATGLLVVTQEGGDDTPLLTSSPGGSGTALLGSTVALVVGAAVAVLGLGFLLGIIDPAALLDRQ